MPAKSIFVLIILIMCLDTGQGEDDCRSLSDGCSCPIPGHLRCIGKKNELEEILKKSQNITLLDISLSNLNKLEMGTFAHVQDLSALVISSSQLRLIAHDAFLPLRPSLTALSLPNNLLKNIPDEIFSLPILNRLDLSQNHINAISDQLSSLTSLEFLDLSDNELSDINQVKLPSSLRKLVLERNQLSMTSVAEFNYGRVRELDLSFNQLNGSLKPSSFLNSYTLRNLDLSFNALVSLTNQCFAWCPKLKNLNLKHNKIEVMQPLAFVQLRSLKSLDLSSNGILELPLDIFKPLVNLEHLDLSNNHLQVISSTLTTGLVSLDTLKLAHNDIIKIEPLKDVTESLSTLLLDSNPLECSCQLKQFQAWIQDSVHLSLSSKRSVRCSTPTKYANAILNNLDQLTCDDNDSLTEDIIPLQQSIPEEFRLLSKSLNSDELSLKWLVAVDNFTSDQVQLYKELEQGQVQFYSAPLIVNNLENRTILEANFDLKKIGIFAHEDIHSVTAILACATIVKSDLTAVTNCTRVELSKANKTSIMTQNTIKLVGVEATYSHPGSVKVFLDVTGQSRDHCQFNLQVEAGDYDDLGERVVASHKIRCQAKEFNFQGLRFAPNDKVRVCAWLGFYVTNSVCSNVITIQPSPSQMKAMAKPPRHSVPVLPLVLTLVFLAVGIAALVVLYLIVKGYLSDRHKAELFRMRFCYINNNNANQVDNRRPPGLFIRWTHRFYAWKRRHHHPVQDSDELSLREESTFDTSVV